MFKNGITIIAIMAIILLASGCTNYRQPTGNVSNLPTVLKSSKSSAPSNGNTVNYADFYKPIINAYFALEQSGYTSYDEKILSKDVCLIPGGDGSYFIDYDKKPVLVYAFCNLDGYDTPELLIGADLGIDDGAATGSNVFVTGIYGLRDDKPVSLIQVGNWSQLNFFTDENDNAVIEKISGTHIDYAAEYFYKIDKNETLITLDKLYTYGKINDYNKPDDISYSHTKDINGKEVSITEQEYLALMQKYGSVAYLDNTGDFKTNEIVINSWELLSMYKSEPSLVPTLKVTPTSETTSEGSEKTDCKELTGYSSDNILNLGLIAEQGDWLYGPLNYKLYKISKDGTNLKKICDDDVYYVNIEGDYIYYSKYFYNSDEFGIFRIKKDGTEKKQLSSDYGDNLTVLGDTIYYSSIKYNYDSKSPKIESTEIAIYKMKTDGSSVDRILYEKALGEFIKVQSFIIYKNWIYFISIQNGAMLCRMHTDGTNLEIVSDQIFYDSKIGNSAFNISNDWIYYTNLYDKNRLYKIKLDGSDNVLVLNDSVMAINIYEDYIFYTSYYDDYLYKVKKDGSCKTLLIDKPVYTPNIVDGYVYCKTGNDYERLKVSINGGEVINIECRD